MADPLDLAVGGHEFEGQDVIGGGAPGERVRPSRVLGDVATNCAGSLGTGIGRVGQAVPPRLSSQVEIDDARLDDGGLVLDIDVENPTHPVHADDDAALGRERAAAQSGARASRGDRGVVLVGDLDQVDDVVGVDR